MVFQGFLLVASEIQKSVLVFQDNIIESKIDTEIFAS